jgi:hypothetical protein
VRDVAYHTAEINSIEAFREDVGAHEFRGTMFNHDMTVGNRLMQRSDVNAVRAREMPHGGVAPGRDDRYGGGVVFHEPRLHFPPC